MYEPVDKINNVFIKDADPRIDNNWFLVSPTPFFISLCAYMFVVKVALPKYMENKKAYQLKNVLIAYNAIQVIVNAYLFYLTVDIWYGYKRYNFWKCTSVDLTNSIESKKCISALYLYFLSKYTDFFDTFFFILRKKNNQVTFLHVYHHLTTPAFTWFVLRYYPGGSFIYFTVLNTFVHIVMYAYYMLAAMGPKIQKYLWWKKYITTIQLIQFTLGMIHIGFGYITKDCNIPKPVFLLYSFNGLLFFWLFGQFYIRSYSQTQRKRSMVKESTVITNKDDPRISSDASTSQNGSSFVKQRVQT